MFVFFLNMVNFYLVKLERTGVLLLYFFFHYLEVNFDLEKKKLGGSSPNFIFKAVNLDSTVMEKGELMVKLDLTILLKGEQR